MRREFQAHNRVLGRRLKGPGAWLDGGDSVCDIKNWVEESARHLQGYG